MIFRSFVHTVTFYAVYCVFLRNTKIINILEHNKISYKLKNIPNGGYLVIHTFSHHKNGNVYDRYIEVPLSNW